MNDYNYIALDMAGNKVRGTRQAEDKKELFSILRKEGLFLDSARKKEVIKIQAKRMKNDALADLTRQMGSMLGAGVPMIKTLEILREREEDKKKKNLYGKLFEHINTGLSLSEAMQMCGAVFPDIMVNMIKAGEANGDLEEAMIKLANYFTKEHKTTSKIKLALAYPMVLVVVGTIVTLIIFVWVLPQLFDVFADLELPWFTQAMISFSNALVNYWYLFLGGGVLLVSGAITAAKLPAVKAKLDIIKLKLPKVGKLTRIIYTERFARTLSSLYGGGISVIDAINISGQVIGNVYIKKQLEDVTEKIKEGGGLGESLEKVDGLDRKLTSAVFIGEESGKLDELLTSLSDTFEHDAETATQKLVSLIEPITITVLAVVIGGIAVSVMIPLFSIYDSY